MGIDYGCYLGIGFIADKETIVAPFRVTTEEEFHMEDRFDQKTGKKLAPVKVVDQEEGEEFVLDGKRYDDEYELFEQLAKKLGCSIDNTGGYTNGETLFITLDIETDDGGVDDGRFTVGGGIAFDEVVKLKSKLKKVADGFKKLGIELGEAKVFPAWYIS